MIGIIDYGMGNLHSVASACRHLGLQTLISDDPAELETCERLILPGVGAFGDMDRMLRRSGLRDWIRVQVSEKKTPLLGICLGMQALFETSFEFGTWQGLGFMEGSVQAMEPVDCTEDGRRCVLPVPQIGWNRLFVSSSSPLSARIGEDPYVYFDHSYVLTGWNPADLVAYAQYGPYTVPAILIRDTVMGCQFHPEKSGETGLAILNWFGKEFCHDSASCN